ncbi:MAG: 30S ribosomal protein S16 [Lentisphaeria bacterium]|nr:30S ribosomal protein S16 [Lentisphaeria bacterium]
MKKTGGKNWISFRVVVCDVRSSRDGYMVEEVGFYDPRQSNEKIDVERVEYWISQGAQMSDTVADIYKRAKEGKSKVRGVADPYTKKKNFKKEAAEA